MTMPDCKHCGRPSPLGEVCYACRSLELHGYDLSTDEVSGSKMFKNRDTNHFYTGFKAALAVILKERMDNE